MRYFLTAVKTYAGQRPIFYTSGDLHNYELDQTLDILSLSRSISFKTTVFQARSDFFRVGKLTLRLNAALPQWIPGSGWLQSDRDHLMSVTTDSADVLWRGYATSVKATKDAGAEWTFSSLYDRLDDVQIAGDDDETRAAIPAQDIMDEVADQLPDVWPTVDASAWADVFRPDQNTSARDFVAKILTAEGEILVPDANGELEVRAIGPRQATFDPAAGLTIKSSDLLSLTVKDDKEFLYNTITYTPHGAEQTTYQGELDVYREPGNFIFRYGRRELQMDFDHLSQADAVFVAEEWQGRLLRPRRRCMVTLPNPDSQILLLDRVKLELDDVADIPIPLWGEFIVTGVKINTAAETVEIELEDAQEITQAPPVRLPDAVAPTVTIAAVTRVDEGAALDLSVSASGGTYDTLAYAWVVVSGGGAFSNANTSAPTYTAPAVPANVRVRCTVTADGNGGNAAIGTSDTASDTEDFTVGAAPTAGNEQTFNIVADDFSNSTAGGVPSVGFVLSSSRREAINASLTGGPSRYFGAVIAVSNGQFRLWVADPQSEFPRDAGDDLSALFESSGSVEITIDGNTLLVALAGADTSEPYEWTPDNAAEVIAFHDAVDVHPRNSVSGVVVLRDFVPPPPPPSPVDAPVSTVLGPNSIRWDWMESS